jgi:hypothetical protein
MSVVKSWAAKKRIEAALKELRTLLTREDVNTAVVKDQFEKLTVVRQMIIDDAVRTMWSKVALTVLDNSSAYTMTNNQSQNHLTLES